MCTAVPSPSLNGVGRSWPRGTFLSVLTPQVREDLLRLGERRRYDHGSVLLFEGERSTHVILLLQGLVKVTSDLETGRMALLGIRMGGDLVGEMAMLNDRARSATVSTCGPVALRVIPERQFTTFLRRRPEAAIALSSMISQRLRWANRRRTDFNGYPTGVRLARVLVEVAGTYGHQTEDGIAFDVTLTQDEFGAMIGADADTTGRELRRLKAVGTIQTGYRRTIIRDLEALRARGNLFGEEW
jgi:CRP-like cAMP-binding protein